MADTSTNTVERVVKAQFVRYTKIVQPPGAKEPRPVIVSARRGDTIQVLEEEAAKGAALGSFHEDAEIRHTPEGDVVEVDINEMSDADLATWIKEDKPKAPDVVGLSNNNPELAERLLNAERTATGGNPRKTVNEPLTKIMDDAASQPSQGQVPVESTGTP